MRVLLVEDEEGVRMTLAATLELDDFEVTEAESAEDALQLLEDGAEPDVVLSDIQMPGMSGVEMTRRIRETHASLPVILMTAFTDEDDVRAGIHSGVYTVLSKPFDVDDASDALRRASRRPSVLVVDDRESDAESLSEALEAVGVAVIPRFDGESALRALDDGNVDVCVTDLRMPDMDGVELLQRIRALDPSIRFVVFSGYDVPHLMQRAAAAGVVSCLRKPVDVGYLAEVIAHARRLSRCENGAS